MSDQPDFSNINDWNRQVIEEFRANGGKVGGQFEGAPMILVHHFGAKSGTERVSPMVYFPDGDRLLIIASKAGAPTNPDWYHNLKAHPRVDVEVGTETFPVTVEELSGAERDEKWARVTAAMPGFAEYQEKTTRTIPVLALTRV
ncbi:MAG TPA: nitroreductase family deazaflavin-dependent oxidoreductase [Pseudonocardia sp.]|jgi:deazaflavin-dependent oxidoreductase (nitroreductase family)